MKKSFLFSIVGIIIVLAGVYFSQQAYMKGIGKTAVSDATNQVKSYLSQGTNWARTNVYPKITGEVQARGDMVKAAVGNAQKNISENVAQKISNYFSGIENAVTHPGTPQNCPAVQPASSQPSTPSAQ